VKWLIQWAFHREENPAPPVLAEEDREPIAARDSEIQVGAEGVDTRRILAGDHSVTHPFQ
jgi:hypothetical protein